ncbi:hypothetical protein [Desulfogranum mediterraneum]|uniref:hypothetical protein n=1 Tax=Desulfogranum mediterraneum TaxID=160661 RepID=UPI00048BD37D|nr:hypothetical protein [Desulfogranum mediterraneum]
MKRVMVVLAVVSLALFAGQAVATDAADAPDKAAISKHVDEIVLAIDGGKDAAAFAADAYTPYAFIMEQGGLLIVHPSLAGQDLKTKAMPIYEALQAATADGVWINYQWKGKEKHTYAKKTKTDLIVASGY